MKYFWLICLMSSAAYGATRVFTTYTDDYSLRTEFGNIYDNLQDQQFNQVDSTPSYTVLKDGQIVIYKSSANAVNVNLMLRAGTTLYVSPNFPVIQGR